VLLQILLHSEIGREINEFSFKDVANTLFNKMYERHPHVFKETKEKSKEEVLHDWEKNKRRKDTLNISKILASFITAFDFRKKQNSSVLNLETRKRFLKNRRRIKRRNNLKDIRFITPNAFSYG